MVDFVKEQIKKKTSYLKDFDRLLKEYNEENEIIKGYNGRQILELLQNCDDEGSTEVLIKLDQERNMITISNNGTPFSEKGYKSLFMAYRSSKTSKKDYIGNKGLGFRSIINWSDQIEIRSNNLSLTYNQNEKTNFFHKNYDDKKRKEILKGEGLIETAIPVPFLGIPKVEVIKIGDYVTSIVITYKSEPEILESILSQVKEITPETLFFLSNLKRVNFEGFDDDVESIEMHKEAINNDSDSFGPIEKITYNDTTWYIFKEEETLGKVIESDKIEEEFYQIKIAIEENMAKPTGKLYSFFPTNIILDQPYILHATFDLDSTRNQLVKSEKNKVILEKAVEFTIQVVKYFTQEDVSYKPLQILHHSHKADTLKNLGYYQLIEDAIRTEAVFPCVDLEYRTMNDVVYFSNSFAKMLQTINATDEIGFHILPLDNIDISKYSFFNSIDDNILILNDIVEILNNISAFSLSIEKRALFIYELVKNGKELKTRHRNQLNLLIDKYDNVILGSEYVYTPETKGSNLRTPGYANIKFINRKLYDALSEQFGYNSEKDKNRSRFVTEKLQGLCNIQSFEPANLARKIISEAKTEIKKPDVNEIEIVQEMNACLFHNFEFINAEARNTFSVADIPSISLSGNIANSTQLILSNAYPKGHINQIIFDGIYTDANYIANPIELGVHLNSEDDIYKVEEFLLWLNVNKHAKYINRQVHTHEMDNYFRSIHQGTYTRYSLNVITTEDFVEILNYISLENLIIWIHFDSIFKAQLNDNSNKDMVGYFYRSNYQYHVKPSFMKYLIEKHYNIKFRDLLIDEEYKWVNDLEINYRHPVFVEHNLSKSVIKGILVELGAKDNFNELPIGKVVEIINKFCVKYPDGTKSSSFYKKALSHFKENQIEINSPIQLFADDGEQLAIYNQNQIYFSDKLKLPNRLKKDFPIFNFQAGYGGVDVIKFYGIKNLNTIKIELNSYQILNDLTERFDAHLTNFKPYILTQRIHDISDMNSQQNQALICNRIKVMLCSELDYKVNGKHYQTSNYEYIHYDEHTYYMKVDVSDILDELIDNSSFTYSIAEILALSFDVKSNFRNIIRSTKEVVQSDIIRDFGEDTLKEAKELLGMSDHKQAFWKSIFTLRNIDYNEGLDDVALNTLLLEKLHIEIDIADLNYDDISNNTQLEKLKNLFQDLDIQLSEFAKIYPHKISYAKHHYRTIRGIILSNKLKVKTAIWNNLLSATIEDQKNFLTVIDQLESYEDFAKKVSEENSHEFEIDKVAILDRYITSVYGGLNLDEVMEFGNILKLNGSSFSDSQLEIINQDIELKSLLHFKEALDDLKSILEVNIVVVDKKETSPREVINELPTKKLELVSSENLKLKVKQSRRTGSGKPYMPKIEDSRKLKEIGNASEEFVMQHLKKNNYVNVYKASDDNEGLHYDIRYTDDEGIIKYIEVKSFDNGMFYLSKDQFNFGLENKEDFEIWLVKNKETIIPIKDFYTNSKYQPITNEYIIYLDMVD